MRPPGPGRCSGDEVESKTGSSPSLPRPPGTSWRALGDELGAGLAGMGARSHQCTCGDSSSKNPRTTAWVVFAAGALYTFFFSFYFLSFVPGPFFLPPCSPRSLPPFLSSFLYRFKLCCNK